ncbi:MAG: hypothetical protein V1872_05490 [bacterium]
MIVEKPLSFVSTFIEKIDESLRDHSPNQGLSHIQKVWLSFCISCILITNSVCWAAFKHRSTNTLSTSALSWMFCHSKITWELLLHTGIKVLLLLFGITQGALLVDDTDNKRSKSTTKIGYVHKLKDKSSNGYIMGQNIVFLVLVTPSITIPVGFTFYMPDPELTKWNKRIKELKEQNVPSKDYPPKPKENSKYPTKQQIALNILTEFKLYHPTVKVKSILADNLYGTACFMDNASKTFDNV